MIEIGSQPECENFPGRLRDLCEGQGRDGRPNPTRKAAKAFRLANGLEELRQSVSQPPVREPLVPRINRESAKPASKGVGTHLKEIFQSLGVDIPGCFTCGSVGAEMNSAGVSGCVARRDEFIDGIKGRAKTVSYAKWMLAAGNAVLNGLAFVINPLDPIPGLFDEAVRRAES